MKKTIISLFIIIGLFFININGVNAVKSCDYSIKCTYYLSDLKTPVETSVNNGGSAPTVYLGGGYLNVVFQCGKKATKKVENCNNDEFVAVAFVSKQKVDDFYVVKDSIDVTIDAFSDIMSTEKLKKKFSDADNFTCPNLYYSQSSSKNPSGGEKISVTVNFNNVNTKISGGTPFPLAVKDSSECNSKGYEPNEEDLREETRKLASNAQGNHLSGNSKKVTADEDKIKEWAKNHGQEYGTGSVGDPCNVIDGELRNMLHGIFLFISVTGIILVVVMTTLSFIKAIVGSDDEKFRDAFKHLLTRIIVVIILLLLPMILDFAIDLINYYSDGRVSIGSDQNVFCDITDVDEDADEK